MNTTGGITKKMASKPPYIQAGVAAYRAALSERKDWHAAVVAAIETAISQLPDNRMETDNQENDN